MLVPRVTANWLMFFRANSPRRSDQAPRCLGSLDHLSDVATEMDDRSLCNLMDNQPLADPELRHTFMRVGNWPRRR